MLSSDLSSVSPPESFIQNVQETSPGNFGDAHGSRFSLGPTQDQAVEDAQDIEKDCKVVVTYMAHTKDSEAQVLKRVLRIKIYSADTYITVFATWSINRYLDWLLQSFYQVSQISN